jgi:hypothetical protein
VVVYCIGFAMKATSKASSTVKAGWGHALGRQHDIGMGIYHFAPNALLPLVWAGAGNKAEFGSSSVKVDVDGAGLRMAVALIPGAGLNLQLDCNTPCALPTSICVASLNTVMAGFSLADCLAGFAAMIADIAVTYLSGKIAQGLVAGAGAVVAGILAEVAGGLEIMLVAGVAAAAFPTAAEFLGKAAEQVVGWMIGSPLGYSFSWAPGNVYGAALNDAVNDYISPSPAPTAPPSASGSSTPPTPPAPSASPGPR